MKEPCLTCHPKLRKLCENGGEHCLEWMLWLFGLSKGRNSVQTYIWDYYADDDEWKKMKYTEREE